MKNLTAIIGQALVPMMLLMATPAWAQDPPLTPGQTLFESGKKAFEEERWPDALKMFTDAYKLEPLPKTAAWLGRVQAKMGDYVAAADNLELYLREEKQIPEKARQNVEQELARAREKIVTMRVTVEPADASVSVDKLPLDPKRASSPIYLLPGGHLVDVQKAGFEPYRFEQSYKPGDTPTINAVLKPVVVNDVKNPQGGVPPLAIAGFVVSGGLLVTSAITGIAAKVANDKAYDAVYGAVHGTGCVTDAKCKPIYDEQYGRSTTFSIVALASLGVGVGVGVATLVYTVKASKSSDGANATKTSWNIVPTPGGILVRGTW